MLDLNDNLRPIPYCCPYPTCGTNRPVTSQTFAAPDRNSTYWPKKNRKISLRHLRPIKNVGDSMRLAVRRKQLTSLTLGNYDIQSVYLIIQFHILFHILYLTRPSHDNTTEQLSHLKSFDVPVSDRRGSDTSDQRNGGMFQSHTL